jgi:hypothetical protein
MRRYRHLTRMIVIAYNVMRIGEFKAKQIKKFKDGKRTAK